MALCVATVTERSTEPVTEHSRTGGFAGEHCRFDCLRRVGTLILYALKRQNWMDLDRATRRRLAIGLLVVAVFAIIAYAAFAFITVVVFAVFLYYAVRPIFRSLGRLGLPRRVRALLSLFLFGIPFVLLIAYAVALVALEAQAVLDSELVEQLLVELDLIGVNDDASDEIANLVADGALLDAVAELGFSIVGVLGGLFVQLLLIVVAVYYMLVDGPRLVEWLLERYDDDGVLRAYAAAVDPELSLTLFGNIVNVFITAIIGIVVFVGFNALAPAAITIPAPVLLGALAGIGSLIPVIGIKLVYVPIIGWLSVLALQANDLSLFVPIAVLLAVSAVVVDFIPDFFIRAQISGDATHTGLLLLSYVAGPTLFGFYGLFLAPIVLVLSIHAVTILAPYVLSGTLPRARQTTLDEFINR